MVILKRTAVIILCLIFAASALSTRALASNGGTVSLSCDTALPGKTATITLCLSDCKGFSNLGFQIGYNSDVLTLTGVQRLSIPGVSSNTSSDSTVNPYYLGWWSNTDCVFDGVLALLTFRVADDAKPGCYPVTISFYVGPNGNFKDGSSLNYDEKFVALGLTYVSGSITVTESKLTVSEPTTTDGISFTVWPEATVPLTGTLLAVLYDKEKRLIEVKLYAAAKEVLVELDKDGVTVNVMWVAGIAELIPMCQAKHIRIQP